MSNRKLVGIILILLGIGFLLQQFTAFDFGDILYTYWPSILIIIGLVKLVQKQSSTLGNIILILIGALFQANRLGLINYSFGDIFWPAILILVGLNFILSRKPNYSSDSLDEESSVNNFVIFSGIKTLNYSQSFKGGTATALFGGIDIDLRGANISDGEAYLELTAMFGGIDLLVPQDWKVEVTGVPILGGWENKTILNTNPDAPVLKVKCFVAFGGIEVK